MRPWADLIPLWPSPFFFLLGQGGNQNFWMVQWGKRIFKTSHSGRYRVCHVFFLLGQRREPNIFGGPMGAEFFQEGGARGADCIFSWGIRIYLPAGKRGKRILDACKGGGRKNIDCFSQIDASLPVKNDTFFSKLYIFAYLLLLNFRLMVNML